MPPDGPCRGLLPAASGAMRTYSPFVQCRTEITASAAMTETHCWFRVAAPLAHISFAVGVYVRQTTGIRNNYGICARTASGRIVVVVHPSKRVSHTLLNGR